MTRDTPCWHILFFSLILFWRVSSCDSSMAAQWGHANIWHGQHGSYQLWDHILLESQSRIWRQLNKIPDHHNGLQNGSFFSVKHGTWLKSSLWVPFGSDMLWFLLWEIVVLWAVRRCSDKRVPWSNRFGNLGLTSRQVSCRTSQSLYHVDISWEFQWVWDMCAIFLKLIWRENSSIPEYLKDWYSLGHNLRNTIYPIMVGAVFSSVLFSPLCLE